MNGIIRKELTFGSSKVRIAEWRDGGAVAKVRMLSPGRFFHLKIRLLPVLLSPKQQHTLTLKSVDP